MAFPFYPVGMITATLFLAGALAVFRALLLALDRGAAELRGSIGPGLVRGVQAWTWRPQLPDRPSQRTPAFSGRELKRANLPAGATLEDLATPPDIDVQAVRTTTHAR